MDCFLWKIPISFGKLALHRSHAGDIGMDGELDLDKSHDFYSGTELHNMNAKFIAAMSAAIRAHLEHPPRDS
jgi:hypothetical protein